MAHVERRRRNGRSAWRARYRAPDGRERSKSFARRADAERFHALVFAGPRGGPLRYSRFYSHVWRPTLAQLGLPPAGVHSLRHSAAAAMVAAGASLKALQTVLGHGSATFSLTVYGHLFDDDLDALAGRLDELRGGPANGEELPRPTRGPVAAKVTARRAHNA